MKEKMYKSTRVQKYAGRFYLCTFLLFYSLAFGLAEAAPRNYNQALLSWQHVADDWTKYFRADCGPAPGQYDRFNRTTGLATYLNISLILPRRNGIYYCIVRGANDSDPVDPIGEATNEVCFEIQGNWIYPNECGGS